MQFDPLFHTLAQRHGFRTYLAGLLMPRDRSKTLTALVGAEPLVQSQAAEVQRLQFFLSEAGWNADAITAQRLALLMHAEDSAPSGSTPGPGQAGSVVPHQTPHRPGIG
ncbi:MAG: hypothetical protein ACJ8HJ_07190 [Massilia sp.]